MSHVIYKHKLEVTDRQIVEFKGLVTFLHIIEQNGNLVFYAVHDKQEYESEKAEPVKFEFLIKGTGHEFDQDIVHKYYYMGTVKQNAFVWHIYIRELPEEKKEAESDTK